MFYLTTELGRMMSIHEARPIVPTTAGQTTPQGLSVLDLATDRRWLRQSGEHPGSRAAWGAVHNCWVRFANDRLPPRGTDALDRAADPHALGDGCGSRCLNGKSKRHLSDD